MLKIISDFSKMPITNMHVLLLKRPRKFLNDWQRVSVGVWRTPSMTSPTHCLVGYCFITAAALPVLHVLIEKAIRFIRNFCLNLISVQSRITTNWNSQTMACSVTPFYWTGTFSKQSSKEPLPNTLFVFIHVYLFEAKLLSDTCWATSRHFNEESGNCHK